jgi:hypothetical protein
MPSLMISGPCKLLLVVYIVAISEAFELIAYRVVYRVVCTIVKWIFSITSTHSNPHLVAMGNGYLGNVLKIYSDCIERVESSDGYREERGKEPGLFRLLLMLRAYSYGVGFDL